MTAPAPRACIVSVGNELLFGQTVDTNSAWMGRALATRGIPVLRRYVVSDTPAEIGAAVAEAIAVADLVIVSGGLGPTEDDVTREVVAELLGAPLEVDEVLLGALRERFRARGYEQMPASNVSQAEVPRGAQVLANPHGTAPGLLMRGDSAVVVLLPGVPRELRGIFEGALGDVLEDTFAGRAVPVWHRMVHTTGIAESRLAELVQEALDREPSVGGEDGNVSVAYLPDLRGVDLRITARSVEEEQATARLQRVVERIVSVLGPWTFAARSGDIVEAVSGRLRARGLKLATAESCTAGLIAKRMTDFSGSSEVFAGGVVAYEDSVKRSLLGVSKSDLARHGAVSEEVAAAMATGVVELLGADVGIGVTGVAGPGGGSHEKPVGMVWLASSIQGSVNTELVHFVGDRHAVRERAAQGALALVLRDLGGMGPSL